MIVTIAQMEEKLKKGELSFAYLFYGEENYFIETFVKKIRKIFGECIKGINYIQIDENTINELIADLETPSFRI